MKNDIAIIGLGYVGLPLAVAFSKKEFNVVGFDINKSRIEELKRHKDHTMEVSSKELESSKTLNFTYQSEDLRYVNIYILTVPTPITKENQSVVIHK